MSTLSTLTRPALRWHGGKWLLAPWIIDHLPRHRCYVECFGGAASVLLRKPRSSAEVYNDLDEEVVSFFRVLRDPASAVCLQQLVALTPFARTELTDAYTPADNAVERARRLLVRSYMGFGSDASRADIVTGFRGSSKRSYAAPLKGTAAADWMTYAEAIPALVARMQGVIVENVEALSCMTRHDDPNTLHYVDPPYLPSTRKLDHRNHGYRYEMTAAEHRALLQFLPMLRGMVVLSGYTSPDYEAALTGWHQVSRAAMAFGAQPRTETIWLNPQAARHLDQQSLFA